MENQTQNNTSPTVPRHLVHRILAQSYSLYFFSIIFGLLFDFIFSVSYFNNTQVEMVGFLLVFVGTVLVVWTQRTPHSLVVKELTVQHFCRGPYCYTRSPVNYGLFFLALGLGFVLNAPFIILFSLVSLLVSRLFFLKKEEEILTRKYGTPYIEYKSLVKF